MSESDVAQREVDSYLRSLEVALHKLPPDQARDITQEIRSHIADKAAAGGGMTLAAVRPALFALGRPEELASLYLTDDLLARAAASRSPLLVLHSLFKWASLSLAGCIVLLASLVGYVLGVSLVACALLKPLHPHTAGLWAIPGPDVQLSLRLGFGLAPVGGRELLGWWIVPLGLVVGCGLVLLTTRLGSWSIHQFRGRHPVPER